mmetsp:Transcript_8531/g.19640  ORF Transcript_8531/g.19640 Transcript_8531/m.19640 type:complete len:212 (+) Transcript_8531:257-892(+)
MLPVEPGCLLSAEEELASVRPRTSVRHAEHTGTRVLQGEVLVLKLLAVDAAAASAIVVSEVTTLAHEARNNAVERRLLVPFANRQGAQLAEVLSCLWYNVRPQLHMNSASGLTSNSDVEKDSGVSTNLQGLVQSTAGPVHCLVKILLKLFLGFVGFLHLATGVKVSHFGSAPLLTGLLVTSLPQSKNGGIMRQPERRRLAAGLKDQGRNIG